MYFKHCATFNTDVAVYHGALNRSFRSILSVIAVILSKVTADSFSTIEHKTSEFVSSQSMLTAVGEAALRAEMRSRVL